VFCLALIRNHALWGAPRKKLFLRDKIFLYRVSRDKGARPKGFRYLGFPALRKAKIHDKLGCFRNLVHNTSFAI
jgi:hypothetical protein